MRVAVPDRSGKLGAAGSALGRAGVDIRAVDVHLLDGSNVADELLVDLAGRIDPPALEPLLAASGARLLHLARASEHELVDLCVRATQASARLAQALDGAVALLPEVVTGIVPADRVTVAAPGPESVSADRMAIDVAGRHVLVLHRARPAFSATEVARVRAIIAACSEPPASPSHRWLSHDDAPALVRMHERCTADTRYRRYHSPMPRLEGTVLDRLAAGTGMAATYGSEIVAVSHLHIEGETAELAVVVEDSHQRRGIGSALVNQIVAHARDLGVTQVVALAQADNQAIVRCLRAAGLAASARWDHGAVRLTASSDSGPLRTRSTPCPPTVADAPPRVMPA